MRYSSASSSNISDDDNGDEGTSYGRGSIAEGRKQRKHHVSKSPSVRSAKRGETADTREAKSISGDTLRELEDFQGGLTWGKEEIVRWSTSVRQKKRKRI